jgi:uncharacterized protein DUF2628
MAVIKCNECNGAVSTLASACPHCGAPVSQVKTPQQPSPSAPLEHEDLVRLFIGKNYEYYAKKWKKAEERAEKRGLTYQDTWNWAAFFLVLNWSAYRKMYGYSWWFIGILVVEAVCELAFGMSIKAANAINLLVALANGSWGNRIYKDYVEEKVKEIAASGASDEATRMRLANEGGTNLGAAVGFTVAIIILAMLISAFGK